MKFFDIQQTLCNANAKGDKKMFKLISPNLVSMVNVKKNYIFKPVYWEVLIKEGPLKNNNTQIILSNFKIYFLQKKLEIKVCFLLQSSSSSMLQFISYKAE